jgi:hypothetical protein
MTTKELSSMQPTIRRVGAGCLILAATSLLLAGCGGSSSKSTTAAATTATAGQPGARFAAVRQCLAKSGINLPARPARPPGAPRTGGGGIFGGGGGGAAGAGPPLPAGVTRAQFQAALAKCGGVGGRGGARPALTPAQRAVQQAALVKFAACMRQHGVNLPAPNTTGRGPVFNTGKLDTTSRAFTTAETKCMPLLPARFGRGRGGPPPGASAPTTGGA